MTTSIDPQQVLQYKYLNMDNKRFYEDAGKLAECFRGQRHLCRAIPSDPQYGQILIAAGTGEFSERDATKLCRILHRMK